MNILLVGPYWGNAAHGAEPGIYDALVELGHNVSVWDLRVQQYQVGGADYAFDCVDPQNPPSEVLQDEVDVVLCPGPGLNPDVLDSALWKSKDDCFRILWNSEPVRLGNYRSRIEANKKHFGLVCTFDESEIPLYEDMGVSAMFLPQAFNPKWYYPLSLPPSQRFPGHLCFIGSVGGKWQNRVVWLNRILRAGFRVNATTLFEAKRVNHAYNMHDAVLNLGLYCPESGPPEELKAFGLQQRIFECIGAGVLCVTNEIPKGTNELFEHGREVLFYNKDNLEEVLELALNKKTRREIEGRVLEVRDQHTYKARMKRLLAAVDW